MLCPAEQQRDSILGIFQRDSFLSSERRPGFGDSLEKLGMILQSVVEPIILRLEADQDARRSPVASYDDLLLLSDTEVPGEIVFDLRNRYFTNRARLSLRAS